MKKNIINAIFGIIIIFGVAIIILSLFGYKPYRVVSDSMADKFYKNALAIVKDYNEGITLKEHYIIAYKAKDEDGNYSLVLHRIVKIEDEKITTKGDANEDNDSPITYDDVIGVYVFSIPLIGILFASIYPWIIIILLVLCYMIIKQILKELKKNSEGK